MLNNQAEDQTEDTLHTISTDQLDFTTGGGWIKAAAKFTGKKILGPIGAAWTAYDGVTGYLDARDKGKGVGESLWEGAKAAVW